MHVPCDIGLGRSLRWLVASAAALALAGCAPVGPNYAEPNLPVASAWHSELEDGLAGAATDPQTLASWWTTFNDATLSSLIDRAAVGNLDVKSARMRIREARAARGMTEADLYPTLNATGSSTWTRSGGEMGTGETTELHSGGFDAGWELDLFGGTRRSIEAARRRPGRSSTPGRSTGTSKCNRPSSSNT